MMLTAPFRAAQCTRHMPSRARAIARAPLCVARPRCATTTTTRATPAPAASSNVLLNGAAMSLPLMLFAQEALAKDGELGLLEGRTFALLHPAIEFGLLAATLYAGYLGWQWRRARTIGEEIKALKKQIPAGTDDAPAPPSPVAAQVAELEQERKALISGNYKDKHFVMGSLLLGAGVTIAVEGCVNTYIRTGRLFPGPHLYAGAGIVVLWALAAALVPAMQKGDENARSLHIGLNALNVALFLWQVPTGLEIVGKVFEFTSWP